MSNANATKSSARKYVNVLVFDGSNHKVVRMVLVSETATTITVKQGFCGNAVTVPRSTMRP